MKNIRLSLGLMAVLSLSLAAQEGSHSKSETKARKPQTACPVMGGKINKVVFVDHDGKRVYFCCPGCDKAFKKDPAKFIKKIEAKGETVALVQTKDPVNGDKIDKEIFHDTPHGRVYFATKRSLAVFKKKSDEYLKKLRVANIALDPVPKKK